MNRYCRLHEYRHDRHAQIRTKSETKFDAEAFAMNVARAMESGGKALAAYLKPRESGEVQDQPAGRAHRSRQDLHLGRRILAVGPRRARPTCRPSSPRTISISGARRRGGWPARRLQPAIAPSPRDKRFADPEWKSNQFFDFMMQLYLLTTKWAQELVQQRRRARSADPPQGRVLRAADHQRDLAVELRADQSGSAARNACEQRREPRARPDRCWRRTSPPARAR